MNTSTVTTEETVSVTSIMTEASAIQNAENIFNRMDVLCHDCCIVSFIVSGACGEKSLPKAKVEVEGELQDSKAIKGSRIQWFPQGPLNFVSKHTQRISRLLNSFGVRWGDMTIVPLSRLPDLQVQMSAIETEWQRDLEELIDTFDEKVAQHQAENPDIAHIMRKYSMDKDEFKGRFHLKLLPPVAFKPLGLDEGSGEGVADDILDSLYQEVAKQAAEIYDRSFFQRDEFGRKTLRQRANQRIRSQYGVLLEKLKSLAFLAPNIEKIIETTNTVFDSLPKTGWIEGSELAALARWTLVLSNEEQLKNHSNDELVEVEPVTEVDEFGALHETQSSDLDEELYTEKVTSPEEETPVMADAEPEEELDFGFGF
jgi:hypothetical protein